MCLYHVVTVSNHVLCILVIWKNRGCRKNDFSSKKTENPSVAISCIELHKLIANTKNTNIESFPPNCQIDKDKMVIAVNICRRIIDERYRPNLRV